MSATTHVAVALWDVAATLWCVTEDAQRSGVAASANRLAVRRAAWAAGAREARALDVRRAREMTPAQRIDEGLALVRIAQALQSGRHGLS